MQCLQRFYNHFDFHCNRGGGAMVHGKRPVPGRPTDWGWVGVVGWCEGAG